MRSFEKDNKLQLSPHLSIPDKTANSSGENKPNLHEIILCDRLSVELKAYNKINRIKKYIYTIICQ